MEKTKLPFLILDIDRQEQCHGAIYHFGLHLTHVNYMWYIINVFALITEKTQTFYIHTFFSQGLGITPSYRFEGFYYF